MNRLLPSASLRFTHQVKLMQQFLKHALEEHAVALAALRRSSCRRATPPTRAPADSRRRSANSYAGNLSVRVHVPLAQQQHELLLGERADRLRASGIM